MGIQSAGVACLLLIALAFGFADTYRILPGDSRGARENALPLDLRIVGFPAATSP